MTTIRSIIIDDETAARNTLKKFLSVYCPEVLIIDECGTVEKSVKSISELKPELIFLDVHLPDGTGFDMLQQLPEIDFEIIFTTGFDTFAIQAIKYSAIDYLVKPLIAEDLREAVNRVLRKNNERNESIINKQPAAPRNGRIAVPDRNGLKIIQLSEIIYCEAEGNYTMFFLSDNNKILVCKTIKEYENLFPMETFVRIHNSYIINLEHIKSYVKGRGGQVEMSNGTFLDIARNRKQYFLEHILGNQF